MPKDLRQYLDELRRKLPDEFVTVERRVDPKFELSGVLRKLQDLNQYPAAHFRNVKGSEFSVVSNLFASPKRLALALEADPDNLMSESGTGGELTEEQIEDIQDDARTRALNTEHGGWTDAIGDVGVRTPDADHGPPLRVR